MALLEREDIERALTDLVDRLGARGVAADIRLVGGAALAITYPDRGATRDVDALVHPRDEVFPVAVEIAEENGWPADWLNDRVLAFMTHRDSDDDWRLLAARSNVTLRLGSSRLLLAMKLHAARGPRDYEDLDNLVATCGVDTYDAAVEVFEHYYPEDVLKRRPERYLENRFGTVDT